MKMPLNPSEKAVIRVKKPINPKATSEMKQTKKVMTMPGVRGFGINR